MTTHTIDKGYIAANRSVALAERSDRVRIELTGPDRAKVLHNLTTNDVKRLGAGRGSEAFLTNGQGRTLAFLLVHSEDDRLLLRSDPETAEAILGHITKYGVFEDMAATDVSAKTSEWHLVGPEIERAARSAGVPVPEGDLGIAHWKVGGGEVRLIRESPTGRPGLTIVGETSGAAAAAVALAIQTCLSKVEGEAIDNATFDAMRIEAGTPVFGRDITSANLPQEVNRDARAISFVKGCYLGQETVARLDAMGHVNKILFGAVSASEVAPPSGATLRADGKDVGVVTSSAYSPGWSRGVVLGYVKIAHAKPGSALVAAWDGGEVGLTVHALPMIRNR